MPIFDWLRRKPPALTGAPPVRRLKTYSAQSGYVYQYYYLGHRPADTATEFVFDVTSDRKSYEQVTVVVEDGALAQWERQHARSVTATERYAIAKMALFQAFDERAEPRLMRQEVCVRAADVNGILAALDLE